MKWVEPVSPNPHFVKYQDEQNVDRTFIINQDPLNVEIGDCGKYHQSITVEKMQAFQILVCEIDGRESFRHECREVVNLIIRSPLSLLSMPFWG